MGRPKKLPDGLVVRPGYKGYRADFTTPDGKRIRKFLSTDLEAATSILRQLVARHDKAGHDILDNDFPTQELRAGYELYIKQSRPRSYTRYVHSLNTILPALGAAKVRHIDLQGVMRFREERIAGGASPRTTNHDCMILSAMLNWGVKPARLIAFNPIRGLPRLPHDRPKDGRPLTVEEVERLLKASPQPWRDIWYAFLVTGLRSGELGAMTFDDIDWESREIIVRPAVSKTHAERRIPIDTALYAILEQRRAERNARKPGKGKTPAITRMIQAKLTKAHIFTTSQNTPLSHRSCLWGALQRCMKLAKIEAARRDAQGHELDHVDVHSLRRTFATEAIANGADPKSVQELLGHKTLAMTMNIYAKMRGKTKRQTLAILPYGSGVIAPDHLIAYPDGKGLSVQGRPKSVIDTKTEAG